MAYLRSILGLHTWGFTVQSLLCVFQCYSRLLCATLGPLWWVLCGRAAQDYSGLLWSHCGRCAVEGRGSVGYSGPTLADVLRKGYCGGAKRILLNYFRATFYSQPLWATVEWMCCAIRLLTGILWSMCRMSGGGCAMEGLVAGALKSQNPTVLRVRKITSLRNSSALWKRYFELLRDHFNQCAVEELLWATQELLCATQESLWPVCCGRATLSYSGITLASVL